MMAYVTQNSKIWGAYLKFVAPGLSVLFEVTQEGR